MASRVPLFALLFVGCGQVTFGGATDNLDAGLIAIGVATDAAHDSRTPAEVTDGRATDGSGGGPGAGGAPAMPPPLGGAAGAPGCQSLADCTDGVCNLLDHTCVGCMLNGDCKKGKGNLCDLATFTCVECQTNADCDGDKACAGGTCGN